jgi:hypothetical protein
VRLEIKLSLRFMTRSISLSELVGGIGKSGKPNAIDLNGIQEISKSMQPMNIITKMEPLEAETNVRKRN